MDNSASQAFATPIRHYPHWPKRLEARSLIVVLCSTLLIFNSACVTTRTIDPQTQSTMKDEAKAGDAVKVLLRDGSELELTFVEWTAEHFVGQDQAGSLRTIPRQDISQLQVSRTSAGKTALLIVAVIGFVLGIAVAASSSDAIGY